MKTLEELQAADIPHAAMENVGITCNGDSEQVAKAKRILDRYFAVFAAPNVCADPQLAELTGEGVQCVQCGRAQCGIFGAFRWGLCHGEGQCSNCGYPARAIHRIYEKVDDKEPYATIRNLVLQYHPSVLTRGTQSLDAEGQLVDCFAGKDVEADDAED